MDRMILPLIGALALLFCGSAGVWAYDRHPPIGFTLPIPFVHPHVGLPDSLQTQRDEALAAGARAAADLRQCHDNTSTLEAAVGRQNAAVDGLKRDGDARVAASQKAAQAARVVAESYRQNAAAVLAMRRPEGVDACAAADALILKEAGQ